jgi:hypothetical protein
VALQTAPGDFDFQYNHFLRLTAVAADDVQASPSRLAGGAGPDDGLLAPAPAAQQTGPEDGRQVAGERRREEEEKGDGEEGTGGAVDLR